MPLRPPYRRRRTIRTLKVTADSLKLGMIRGQSEPLRGQKPSIRAAGQKLMLKDSVPTAPIVHKRSALDIPAVELATTVPTVHVQTRSQRTARGPKTARPPTESLPCGDLTKFEAAFLELEAKSLIDISAELFPNDPLAVKLPPEAYKNALPARLVYEVKPRDEDAFKEVPALEYSSAQSQRVPKTMERSLRTPRRDLPNLLSFEPSAVARLNVQAVGEARSTVLVRTADAVMKRGQRHRSQQPREGREPTPFELALGLRPANNAS